MKKLLMFMTSIVVILGITMSAQAALVTITFDEPYVTGGVAGSGDRFDGSQIDTEYSSLGATWQDIYTGTSYPTYTGQVVCFPGEHSGSGWSSNYLWVYGNNAGGGVSPATAVVTLSTPSDSFSIDYRRPAQTGTIEVDLYLDTILVYDGSTMTSTATWQTFTAPSVTFNQVHITQSDKTCFDNAKFNMVPIPASFWLLGAGLLPLLRRRMKQ